MSRVAVSVGCPPATPGRGEHVTVSGLSDPVLRRPLIGSGLPGKTPDRVWGHGPVAD